MAEASASSITCFIMPPPTTGGGGTMFSGRTSVRPLTSIPEIRGQGHKRSQGQKSKVKVVNVLNVRNQRSRS